ncbi:MAG TPA: ATP-binding protein [Candidatus Didemnitutus sp.]|nr:ATP-binding protein [Candidatus Didemnitutus sp.]
MKPPVQNEATDAAVLSASELRYRRLFEAARDGILIVDPRTRRIVDANPFLSELLGYDHEEFLGKELFEIGLLKDGAASRAAFSDLQASGYIRYEDLPLRATDGRRVDVEFVSNLYQEGDQQVIQCNIRDITARKKKEDARRLAEEKKSRHADELEDTVSRRTAELRTSNTQLETFVYSIAHDLRAPLRAMQGFAQLLAQDHVANLDQQGRDYTNYINTAAQTMDQMLADLLAFSQINQQKMELSPLALKTVVHSALSSLEAEISLSRARIELISPWPAVLAHAATLRQVLVNLIGNALKFVGNRAPHVRLRTEERPEGRVRIWVEDNGIGIPAEFQQRIFQVFKRLHTTAYAGTGMGLALVQRGVERMGGSVGLVSVPEEGSRFWIELRKAPLAEAGPPPRNQTQ